MFLYCFGRHYLLQWNLGIRGGLISQVHFCVLNRLRTEVAVLNSQVVAISQVVLKTGFTVYALCS